MPWNNQTGGGRPGGGGRGPWGGGPSGGGSPPDLEEFLKRSQEKLRQLLPKGFGGSGTLIVALIVAAVWLVHLVPWTVATRISCPVAVSIA